MIRLVGWTLPILLCAFLSGACSSEETRVDPPDGSVRDGGTAGTDSGGADGSLDAIVPADAAFDAVFPPVDAGPPPCAEGPMPELTAEDVVPGVTFDAPVFLTYAPGDATTLYLVEQAGRVLLIREGTVLPEPFLDIREQVHFLGIFGERGLLGLAFHPQYETNGRFFVAYTPAGATMKNVIAEFRRSDDPDRALPSEVVRLVDIDDPETNHNGGMVAFGPDGYLYASIGDGGAAADMHGTIGNALDLNVLHGKLLRLDVDAHDGGYAALGNPFSPPTGLPQIWARGLRNPWRFSFDRLTGDVFIADVGERLYEEIDFQPAASRGGENYGWRAFEADSVFDPAVEAYATDHRGPIFVLEHGSSTSTLRAACSVTGGYVYRGTAIPALRGTYLFGDFCSLDIGYLRVCEGAVTEAGRIDGLADLGWGLASFGEDNDGELYVLFVRDGIVKRIVSAAAE